MGLVWLYSEVLGLGLQPRNLVWTQVSLKHRDGRIVKSHVCCQVAFLKRCLTSHFHRQDSPFSAALPAIIGRAIFHAVSQVEQGYSTAEPLTFGSR